MNANRQAMTKYNAKWSGAGAQTTVRLYAAAATTARFGVHLQDEALKRLGAELPNHKTHKRYGPAATAWLEWMTA